jgi:adiponectin receptor
MDPTLPYRCCSLLFLLGAIIVHFNSAVYHCYAAHSEATAARLLRYDLAGIGFFILVCMINGVAHAFRCAPAWRVFYLVTQTTLGLLTLATPLFPYWLPMLQSHSAIVKLYTGVVCSGLVPAAHWLFGVASPMEWTLIFPRVVAFFTWLGVGLAFYLTRFPESRWPGRFDVVSHLKAIL